MAWADFIVTEPGEVFALELNTIAGMSWDSNFLTAAGLCRAGTRRRRHRDPA